MERVITEIKLQKNNENRVNIYIDGEYLFSCSNEMVFTHHLVKNKSVNLEEIKSLIDDDNYARCKETSLRIIEKSFKSEKEVKSKLLLKGYDEATIEKAICFLKEYDFVNDSKYAEAYIKEKIKTQGSKKIYYSLMQKGINKQIIKEKLEVISPEEEKMAAMLLCDKKYKTLTKSSTPMESSKLYKKVNDFLVGKGFSYGIVKEVINNKFKAE